MTINIEFETEDILGLNYREIIDNIVNASLDYEEFPYEAEVSVTFTDDEGIRILNKETRNIDKATDVLSFPMIDYPSAGDFEAIDEEDISLFNPETGEIMLGDIVLNQQRIREQAKEYGHSEVRELAFLTAHSMFHLMGYDHMIDSQREDMEKRQKEVLLEEGYKR